MALARPREKSFSSGVRSTSFFRGAALKRRRKRRALNGLQPLKKALILFLAAFFRSLASAMSYTRPKRTPKHHPSSKPAL